MLLKNKYGNLIINVNDECEIATFKNKGYSEVKVNKPAPSKAKAPKDKE